MGDRVLVLFPAVYRHVQTLGTLGEEIGHDVEEAILVRPDFLVEVKIVPGQEIPPVNPAVDIRVVVVIHIQRPGIVTTLDEEL